MEEYIYILPYKIRKNENYKGQEEVVTQRTSFIIKESLIFNIIKEVLSTSNDRKLIEVKEQFSNKINTCKFDEIINFLNEHDLVYISDRKLTLGEINFIQFLSQYTKSLKKYIDKMSKKRFCIYSYGENIDELVNKFRNFDLNYKIIDNEHIDELQDGDIVLASIDCSDVNYLDYIAQKIENKKEVLFAFIVNYEDSFIISPLMNKKNYIDYYSLRTQINIDDFDKKALSKNKLVQDMGVSQLVLEVLTSIMKLNIQTSYDKAIVFNSITKKMEVKKIYYYPDSAVFKSNYLSLKRWDDEID